MWIEAAAGKPRFSAPVALQTSADQQNLGMCLTEKVRLCTQQVQTCRLCGLMPAFKIGWKDCIKLLFSGVAGRPALPGLLGLQEQHCWCEKQAGSALPAAAGMSGKYRRPQQRCLSGLPLCQVFVDQTAGAPDAPFALGTSLWHNSARVWSATKKPCKLMSAVHYALQTMQLCSNWLDPAMSRHEKVVMVQYTSGLAGL